MKKAIGFILVLCLILSFGTISFADTVSVPETPGGVYVLDEAEVLDLDSENALTTKSEKLKADTDLEFYIVTTANKGGASLKDYTYAIFDSWNIGGAEDKGIILVLDIENDDYYLKPGDSIRSTYTGTVLQGYLDTYLESDFADKNYQEGVSKLHDAISSLGRRDFTAQESSLSISVSESSKTESETDEEENAGSGGFWGFITGFFKVVLIIFFILLALVLIINIRGQMVKKKRREARAAARQQRQAARNRAANSEKNPVPVTFDEKDFEEIESNSKEEEYEEEPDFENESVSFEEEDNGLNVGEEDEEFIISAFDDILAKRHSENIDDDFDDIDINDIEPDDFDEEDEEDN